MTTPADIQNPAATADAVAAWLVALLGAHGLVARVEKRQSGTLAVYGGNSDRDEECLFCVGDDVVRAPTLALGRTKTLRKKDIRMSAFGVLRLRCADIAARFVEHKSNRATQEKAWDVAGALKKEGLPAVAFHGRVEINLSLSPEYAAEVGPKIAAVLAARE